MGLISKSVFIKWNSRNKNRYVSLGYTYTKLGDAFEVKVDDLSFGSDVLVQVLCDNSDCAKKLNVQWNSYLKCVKDDYKYFCNKCANELIARENAQKTRLSNSISFEKWCKHNNKELLLKLWNPKKNKLRPNEISYSSDQKIWFNCPNNKHAPEQKRIADITSGHNVNCKQCNSFAQWGLDTFGQNFLREYWDNKRNINNPWKIGAKSHKKVWIKCQRYDCNESYYVSCCNFAKGSRCPKCFESKGEKRIRHWLDNNNYLFSAQKEFGGLMGVNGGTLSYDFYLPKENILIDYQGEFHDGKVSNQTKEDFEKQKEHDRRKCEYAKQHNIRLLEIWYWDFDNIEEILNSELNNKEVKELV